MSMISRHRDSVAVSVHQCMTACTPSWASSVGAVVTKFWLLPVAGQFQPKNCLQLETSVMFHNTSRNCTKSSGCVRSVGRLTGKAVSMAMHCSSCRRGCLGLLSEFWTVVLNIIEDLLIQDVDWLQYCIKNASGYLRRQCRKCVMCMLHVRAAETLPWPGSESLLSSNMIQTRKEPCKMRTANGACKHKCRIVSMYSSALPLISHIPMLIMQQQDPGSSWW